MLGQIIFFSSFFPSTKEIIASQTRIIFCVTIFLRTKKLSGTTFRSCRLGKKFFAVLNFNLCPKDFFSAVVVQRSISVTFEYSIEF